jgi:hypothetical protein
VTGESGPSAAGRLPVISESYFAELMSGQRQREETSAGGRVAPESARERVASVEMVREDTAGAAEASTSFAAARDSLEIQSERSARAASVAGTALEPHSRVLTDEADASRHDNASQHSGEEEGEDNEESYLDTAADQTAATEQGEYSIYLPTEPSSIAEICRFDLGLEGGLPNASSAPSGIKLALQALKKRPKEESEERPNKRTRRRNPYDEPVPPPSSMREQKRINALAELNRSETPLMKALRGERRVTELQWSSNRAPVGPVRDFRRTSSAMRVASPPAGKLSSVSAPYLDRRHPDWTPYATSQSNPSADEAPRVQGDSTQRALWHANAGAERIILSNSYYVEILKDSTDALRKLCARAEGHDWLYR